MTTVNGDPALLTQCLEFCQALASKGQAFSISLTLGSSFTFSLDTRGDTAPAGVMKKKKASPSRIRRNQKRKEDFLKRKSEVSSEVFKCDQCGKLFNTENGLKIHVGKAHKKIEVLRLQQEESGNTSLEVSPAKEVQREEQCPSPPPHPSSPPSGYRIGTLYYPPQSPDPTNCHNCGSRLPPAPYHPDIWKCKKCKEIVPLG